MRRLTRSATDKKIFGVCGGLAEFSDIDVTILRVVAVVSLVCTVGTALFVYLAAALIMPNR